MNEPHPFDQHAATDLLAGQTPDGRTDLEGVAAVVRDLQVWFRDIPAPEPSDELAAFMRAPGVAADPDPARRRLAAGVGAFLATVTGKVVLGTTVAAASVGGLHAADVVDVPLLPERARPAVQQPANGASESRVETADDAEDASEVAPAGAGDFGQRVSEDASDRTEPGVDGQQVADEASEFGTSTAKTQADGTPGADHIPDDPGEGSADTNRRDSGEPGSRAPADAGPPASSGAGTGSSAQHP